MRMLIKVVAVLLLVPFSGYAIAADWGDLTLRIVYDSDKLPKPKPVESSAGTPFCGGLPLKTNDLLVNAKDRGVANVFVYLLEADASKLPVHPDFASSAKNEVKMANKGCAFEPKAVTMRLSQRFVGTNPDPVGHNMKFDSFDNPSFNEAIGAGAKIEKSFKFAEPTPLPVTCGSHLWMKGLLLIRDDPYAAVSDASGRVTLTNLPAGKWNFRIWHERCGYIPKATVGGKPVEWRRGQIEWEIKPGKNDLGEVLVKPEVFRE